MSTTPPSELMDLPQGHVGIGDCAFTTKPMLLTTVLGSCVSVTFHHPGRRAGGMFHAMLPDISMARPNARPCTFADQAVASMLERFAAGGMPARELKVKLFGGAHTMLSMHPLALREILDVGKKNVDSALKTLAEHGLSPEAQDTQGPLGRKLYFATATGEVWVSYLDPGQTRRADSHPLPLEDLV